jgi:ubiquinone/menaquinone biosynthesis C-methylase UbiE
MEPTHENLRAWEEAHRRRAGRSADRPGLPAQVRHALGTLTGKRVLHLGCGTGEGTAELAERGAVVTGVDVEGDALESARERWPSILWVEADPQALPTELRRGRFDLAYSGGGGLDDVVDLDGWSRGIAAALRPRGELLVFDEHPIAARLDRLMHWEHDYFEGTPRLGQVVTALAHAGIVTRALEEYPSPPGNPRHHDRRVPGELLLYGEKRAGG